MEARLRKYPYTKWDGGKEIYNYINVFCNELTLNQEDIGNYLVTEGDEFKMITEGEYQKDYNLDKNARDKIVYGRLGEHCAYRGMKFTKVVIISKTCGGIENRITVNGNVNNGLRLCVCLPLAQSFKLPQKLMGQIAQNRCYTLFVLIFCAEGNHLIIKK